MNSKLSNLYRYDKTNTSKQGIRHKETPFPASFGQKRPRKKEKQPLFPTLSLPFRRFITAISPIFLLYNSYISPIYLLFSIGEI